jgi:hypothetical protein
VSGGTCLTQRYGGGYASLQFNAGNNDNWTGIDVSTGAEWKYWTGGTSGWAHKWTVEKDGDIYNANGTYGTISSDRRLKENITDATSKLDDIMNLKVKSYNFKTGSISGSDGYGYGMRLDGRKEIGFIADEFEDIFPSLVVSSSNIPQYGSISGSNELTDIKGLKVGMEFAILVKAVQELTQAHRDLRAQITGSTDLGQLKAYVSGSTFV